MDQLSAMDASFLYIEAPTMPQHVLGVMLFDAAGSEGRFTVERFREVLEERIHLLPAFERRLVEVPLHMDHPYWIHDPDVDLDEHLHRITLDAPGDLHALGRLVGEIGERLLDRSRPLWELWLVEGLADGRWALISKVHHCMVDGIAGTDLMQLMFDLTPDATHDEPEAWTPQRNPSTAELIAAAVSEKDVSRATELMRAHILGAGSSLLALLESQRRGSVATPKSR
jgi:WS/DGAT/MGAT family acyltransferase